MRPVFASLNIIRLSYFIVSIVQAQQVTEVQMKFFPAIKIHFPLDVKGPLLVGWGGGLS